MPFYTARMENKDRLVPSGSVSVGVQGLVRCWIDEVQELVGRIVMEEKKFITISMALEVMHRAWNKLSNDEKCELVRSETFKTKRRLGRPRGKWDGRWDSHLTKR